MVIRINLLHSEGYQGLWVWAQSSRRDFYYLHISLRLVQTRTPMWQVTLRDTFVLDWPDVGPLRVRNRNVVAITDPGT